MHPAGCRGSTTAMTDSTPNENRPVESTTEKHEDESPEVIARSLREEVDTIRASGESLAERLNDLDRSERKSLDPQPITTDLLETANALIEVAHKLESSRVRKRHRRQNVKTGP